MELRHIVASMVLAKKSWFGFWNKLNYVSLLGMNIGPLGGFDDNGESYVIRYISQICKNGVIIDAGANVGDYTKELCKLFDNASIYSFEPIKSTFKTLSDNICEKNARPINMALGDKDENGMMFYDKENSTLSSLYQRDIDQYGIELSNTEEVRIITLDSFCKSENIEHILFLKIDVEGNELKVLKGAKGLIETGSIDFVQFEFGGSHIDSRNFFRDFWVLLHENYTFNYIMRDGFVPINEYNERLEQFSLANYFCVSKRIKRTDC